MSTSNTPLPDSPPTTISTHLTDRSLTPILTTARSRPQLESLTQLTTAALTTHAAASRFGLGSPQRVMVEHPAGGPVLLCSFLSPAGVGAQRASAEHGGGRSGNGHGHARWEAVADVGQPGGGGGGSGGSGREGADGEGRGETEAPMLVAVVVGAGVEDGYEARRAAGRLERIGKDIQREWVAEGRDGSGDGAE